MRRFLHTAALAAVLVLAGSCNGNKGFDKAFLESDVVSMTYNKEVVFEYDPLTCQLAYNDSRKEFRASTDNMSDFFVVSLESFPSEKGQKISGSISWTGEDYMRDLKNVNFEVEKISGSKVWLWSQQNKIAIVIQVTR